jgi:hypothetical protein
MFENKLDYMNLHPGQVGLVLVYLFQILGYFQWTVRQSAEVENLVIQLKLLILNLVKLTLQFNSLFDI